MAKDRTWEPTESGAVVLYGVPGPSYDPAKFAKGYSLLIDNRREAIAAVYDENCKVREQRVNQQDAWLVRYFPQDARGTWNVVNGEVILLHGGKEIARCFDENGRARLPERTTSFDAAALVGEAT